MLEVNLCYVSLICIIFMYMIIRENFFIVEGIWFVEIGLLCCY